MSKITRVFQKIFALSAANNGQFGSAKLGTKVTTLNVATLQGLGAYDTGWLDAVIVDSAGQPTLPTLEETQSLNYINTYQLAYMFQEGVPEYDVSTTYYQNSIVKSPGTYQLFGSKIDSNVGNATSNTSDWAFLLDLSAAASTNTLTSVVGEIALFADTAGRILKRAATTGLLKATAGVLAAASAGVDYLLPSGSGAALTGVIGTKSFTSAQQTITSNGALTLAHGLGAAPFIFPLQLVCQTGEANWTAGQIINVNYGVLNSGTGLNAAVSSDSTNIYIRYSNSGSVFQYLDATTGAGVSLTNANWKLVVKAIAGA